MYTFYFKLEDINFVSKLRNNELRPLIYNTTDDYNGIGLKYIKNQKIYNIMGKNFLINKGYFGNIVFDDQKFKNVVLTFHYEFEFKIGKKLKVLYTLGAPSLNSIRPNFIFYDGIEIKYNRISFALPHFSDWFFTEHDGFDILYYIGYQF